MNWNLHLRIFTALEMNSYFPPVSRKSRWFFKAIFLVVSWQKLYKFYDVRPMRLAQPYKIKTGNYLVWHGVSVLCWRLSHKGRPLFTCLIHKSIELRFHYSTSQTRRFPNIHKNHIRTFEAIYKCLNARVVVAVSFPAQCRRLPRL